VNGNSTPVITQQATRALTGSEVAMVEEAFSRVMTARSLDPASFGVDASSCMVTNFIWDEVTVGGFACDQPHLVSASRSEIQHLLATFAAD
jgi:hypothetical protein